MPLGASGGPWGRLGAAPWAYGGALGAHGGVLAGPQGKQVGCGELPRSSPGRSAAEPGVPARGKGSKLPVGSYEMFVCLCLDAAPVYATGAADCNRFATPPHQHPTWNVGRANLRQVCFFERLFGAVFPSRLFEQRSAGRPCIIFYDIFGGQGCPGH